MTRTEFSKRTKVIAWNRCGGFCQGCGAKLYPGKFAYDHIRPDALLGEAESDNCQVLCNACHASKTKGDVTRIAKAKRQEAGYIGAKARPAKPFPGSRHDKYRKRMDGKVVLRATGEVL